MEGTAIISTEEYLSLIESRRLLNEYIDGNSIEVTKDFDYRGGVRISETIATKEESVKRAYEKVQNAQKEVNRLIDENSGLVRDKNGLNDRLNKTHKWPLQLDVLDRIKFVLKGRIDISVTENSFKYKI